MLTRHHVELIEIPQRMGAVRKNAADIKMAVDAIELCFERDYITTFVLGTGDSDFTPLVHKLRELNRRVIGIGIEASTSALLPPACDEFLFYERLEGRRARPSRAGASRSHAPHAEAGRAGGRVDGGRRTGRAAGSRTRTSACSSPRRSPGSSAAPSGPVLASMLKRTILRKDPTFNEAELRLPRLRRAAAPPRRPRRRRARARERDGRSRGDASRPSAATRTPRSRCCARRVERLTKKSAPPHLSGLKTQMRKQQPDFSEKRFGYGGFLQFAKAAQDRGFVEMELDDDADDYTVRPGASTPAA